MDNDEIVGVVEETPVLVRVETPEKAASSDLVSFRTVTLLGTEAPFRVLALDKKRHRATVIVNNPLGAAAPAILPFVYLGQYAQVAASGDARGAAIVAGNLFTIEAAGETWCVPGGLACTLSIIEERYI